MKFSLQGKLYKFIYLPNRLCFGPRKITKLLKPPLAELRLDYVKTAAYIYDLVTSAYSLDICFKHVSKCVELLGNLRFVVNPEKSVFGVYN